MQSSIYFTTLCFAGGYDSRFSSRDFREDYTAEDWESEKLPPSSRKENKAKIEPNSTHHDTTSSAKR